jgi:LPS export ABC transporter protein LptC
MKKISSKSIFASLIFLITMSFIINNFLNNNDLFEDNVKNKNSSKKQEKIVGVQIRQQNEDGVRFLIVADTLEEVGSKENMVILENSITTINQNGILTKISAGKAIIKNNYKDFSFLDEVKITKKSRKFTLNTKTLTGTFEKGNYHTNDDVIIVSRNTVVRGKGLKIKKNGEYIKVKGKANLKMLLSKDNAN